MVETAEESTAAPEDARREIAVKELLHFDPINLATMLVLAIAAWVTMRNTIKWHTEWITKHDTECDGLRREQSRILAATQSTNAHLATMAENQEKRIDRIEKFVDSVTRSAQ